MLKNLSIFMIVLGVAITPYSFNLTTNDTIASATEISEMQILADTTWTIDNSPYIVLDYLSVNPGATLTIDPGVIVKVNHGGGINISGKIIANGASGTPIIFTSINDDERGGRSVDWSNGNPQPGDWSNIYVGQGGILVFNNVIVNYGGYEEHVLTKNNSIIKENIALADFLPRGAIKVEGGQAEIDNSEISRNIIGIQSYSYLNAEDPSSQVISEVSIYNSKIFNNTQAGILADGDAQVDAINNWWGDDSGPYNQALNVYGLGNAVSNNVSFYPWVGMSEKPKRNPVIIVPGIIGSYLYDQTGEEVWPSVSSIISDPWDYHLDKLVLPESGDPTGNSVMIPNDIFRELFDKDFFQGLITELGNNGYKENEDLFVFPYDWRWNLNLTAGEDPYGNVQSLKEKIESVKLKTGNDKVDIIAHSMGGLVAKLYMKKFGENSIDKFIDIGTPHLGSPEAFKILMYGDDLGFRMFNVGVLNQNKVKKISQNFPSIYQLLPSRKYFDDNEPNYKSYISDIYDYDNNGVKNNLNYDQSIDLLKNTGRNNNLLLLNDSLHNEIDDYSPSLAGIKTYNIVGCKRPTLGRIYILNKEKSGSWEYGLQYIDGDGTVPLRSSDYMNADQKYYVSGIEHAYLPSAVGVKQLVSSILKGEQDNFDLSAYSNLGTDEGDCSFSGIQIEFHSPIELHVYDSHGNHLGPDANGDINIGIEGAQYDIIENNKFVILPAGGNYRIVGHATQPGSFDAHVRIISNGDYLATGYFNEVPLLSTSTNIEIKLAPDTEKLVMQIDQNGDDVFEEEREPDTILNEEESQDVDKPETDVSMNGTLGSNDWYNSDVNFELNSADNAGGSGVLKTEYSLDNGTNWIEYEAPFVIGQEGTTTIFYQATDRIGNVENSKTKVIKIDKTNPNLDIVIPHAGQEFLNSDTLDIVYLVNDDYSGFASSTFSMDGNTLASTTVSLSEFGVGRHTLKIEAEDISGLKNSVAVDFNIIASNTTIDSTIDDINRLYRVKEIYKEVVKTSLIAELKLIKNIEEKYGVKHNYYFNKINANLIKLEYQAILKTLDFYKKLNWLSKNAYDIIKNDINYLISNF